MLKTPYRWLTILIALTVLVGVALRFTNLATRAYWHDEAYTLLRISGHVIPDITQSYFNGSIFPIEKIQQFQAIFPGKTIGDTISALSREDQHHPPIYYVMTWLWMNWFGDSVHVTRTLPALISTIAVPCMFWLCWELFEAELPAWLGMGLMAISPFQIYYSQEIREYGLWSLMVIVTTALLVRAMKRNTWLDWNLYAVATIASLYSALFSCFVLFSHSVYVLIEQRFRLTQRARRFLFAAVLSMVAFLPWVTIFLTNLSTVSSLTSWMTLEITRFQLLEKWVYNLQFVFLEPFKMPDSVRLTTASLLLLLLIYAFICLVKFSPRQVWLLIGCLIIPASVSLLGADLILGGIRSTNSRYFIPTYVGAQLLLAFILSYNLSTVKLKTFVYQRWALLTLVIIMGGLLSSSYQILRWGVSEQQSIAQVINASDRPLLISGEQGYSGGGTVGDILALSNLLDPDVRVQLVIQPNNPEVPSDIEHIYLYKPLTYLNETLEKQFTVESVYEDKLFRLVRK